LKDLRIGIIGNPDRNGITDALGTLLASLKEFKPKQCVLADDVRSIVDDTSCRFEDDYYKIASQSDVIFALGGDGTMLGASRAIMRANPECKLLGINLGKLGFIAENHPDVIPRLVSSLNDGSLKNEKRLIVTATITSLDELEGVIIKHDDLSPERQGKNTASADMIALNEIVIDNFGSTRMLTFEVMVNGALLGIMRADGLIVASPTGSTGYAVSAGGPIIEPTSPVMLITPIAPHSLSVRPIIVDEGSEIVILARSNESRQALVVADGQEEVVANTTAEVRIKAGDKKLNLLRLPDNSYFDLLREKMFWSVDPIEGTKGRR
jgi:NAD+ kinase